MEKEKYCLVLSGGGAKGVFHIGAWKALRELDVEIEAVVGNSIGAIIATFVAQGMYDELEDIGSRIGLDYILNVPDELVENGELSINLKKRSAFKEFYRISASKGGLDTSPMRALLHKHVDEETIRRGTVDFGVVAYNISEMKPREVFVEEMEEGEIVSYAMASSAFPGFERPEIAGKKYIDGGVYDNIPFAMAKNRGYKNIIVVDIGGAGVNKKPDVVGTRTIYIKNSINMGGVLDFDRKFMDEFTVLGYLDTMKTFGKLHGIEYFIEPDDNLERMFIDFVKSSAGKEALYAGFSSRLMPVSSDEDLETTIRKFLPKKHCYDPNWLPLFADCAAHSLGLERIRSYSYEELFEAISAKEKEIAAEVDMLKVSGTKEIESKLRKELRKRELLNTPYVYYLLAETLLPDRLRGTLNRHAGVHLPKLSTGIRFIDVMDSFQTYASGART